MVAFKNESSNESVGRDESKEDLSEAQRKLREQLAQARTREKENQAPNSRVTFFTRKTVEATEPTFQRADVDDGASEAQHQLRTHLNALRARNPQPQPQPQPQAPGAAGKGRSPSGSPPADDVETGEGASEAQRRLRMQLARARAREPELHASESRATVMRRNAIAGGLAFSILAALVILSWDNRPSDKTATGITTRMMTGIDTAEPETPVAPAPTDVGNETVALPQAQALDATGRQPTAPAEATTEEPAAASDNTPDAPVLQVAEESAASVPTDNPLSPKTVRPRRKPPRGEWPEGFEPELTPAIGGSAQ